jgi:serine phosphatase RsbU (regulator of sigma subunit)
MIWLLLTAFGAAVTAVAGFLGGRGPAVLAFAILGIWLLGRAAFARVGRGSRLERLASGRSAPPLQAADIEALAAARRAPEVAAVIERVFAGRAPSAAVELWTLGDRRGWNRADGTAIPCPPATEALLRFLVEAGGAVDRHALAAHGPELAACAPAPRVWPIERGGRIHGLLWLAGAARGVDPLLQALREPLAEALGDVRMELRIARQTEVAAEVEVAAAMQTALIPDGDPRVVGPLELAGSYIPASRCGGDWWAADELAGGGALILVGDVTGHGIGAARITAAARGAFDVAMRLGAGKPELGALFTALDAAVREVGAGHYHMTCFAAIIDRSRRVRFTGAGHVAPYVVRPGRPGDKVTIDALVARGNPLGVPTGPSVRVSEATVEPGSLLLFYSDGLIDCMNAREERLGDRRMQKLLRELGAESPPIDQVRDRIEALARDFAGGHPQPDDITFVACRVR